ncbi:MAG: hypothetical protein CVU77_03980 [Elusimicrobia bacterium HGW-Elusimicrobia-1]|jgi:hydrogenase nickel incorporation protein HypA/HybF|nr:MAG: hypothetical protein CVU77_03980 [Elusimicrobia bacterium HGW-Elusimicrobia-1]
MHELTIARPLLADIKAEASRKGLKIVSRIIISVGAASGVDPDFLRHSFADHLFAGTSFASAELIIETAQPLIKCRACRKEISREDFIPEKPLQNCPSCGSFVLDVVSGDAVRVLEVV